MNEAPVPSVLAMLVCENIIIEAVTNKKTLVGVFNQIQNSQFPAPFGPFWIYARLADAEGDYVLRLELVHLETNKKILSASGMDVHVPNRLGPHELSLNIQRIFFELPGTYEVLLYANDVWIGRTTVSVVKKEQG